MRKRSGGLEILPKPTLTQRRVPIRFVALIALLVALIAAAVLQERQGNAARAAQSRRLADASARAADPWQRAQFAVQAYQTSATAPALDALANAARALPGRRLAGAGGPLTSLAFSPDGSRLAVGVSDGSLQLRDAGTGALMFRLEGHQASVTETVFNWNGKILASSSADGTVRLWDAGSGELRAVLLGHDAPLVDIAFGGRDSDFVVTTRRDSTIRLWDTRNGGLLTILGPTRGLPLAIEVGRESTLPDLRVASELAVEYFDLLNVEPIASLPMPDYAGSAVAFAEQGLVATASETGGVELWDWGASPAAHRLVSGGPSIRWLRFSPDGTQLAAAGDQGALHLWTVAGQYELVGPLDTPVRITALAFSPDGRTLATGADDGLVRLWDTRSGHPRPSLPVHRGKVTGLTYSSRGMLASVGDDGTATLWSAPVSRSTTAAVNDLSGLIHPDRAPGSWSIQCQQRRSDPWDISRDKLCVR
jgi:WD40 repeat protein